jgi:DNA-binding NarL/FixJ family response regulator
MVVDDHELCRDALIDLLNVEPDIEAVAEGSDGWDAVNLVALVRPDVILMDLNMPRMNGADATREVLLRCPDTRVVIVTSQPYSPLVDQALAAGASICVAKGERGSLLAAIRG